MFHIHRRWFLVTNLSLILSLKSTYWKKASRSLNFLQKYETLPWQAPLRKYLACSHHYHFASVVNSNSCTYRLPPLQNNNFSKCVIWGIRIFWFHRKVISHSQDIQVFVFLISWFSKSVTPWWVLVHDTGYIFEYIF